MNLSAYEISLIAGGFTILGSLIGILGTYWFALRLSSINAKRDAGRQVVDAFKTELAQISNGKWSKEIDVEKMLQKAQVKHKSAVITLRYYLSDSQKNELDEAWSEYCELGGSVRFFDYYMKDDGEDLFKLRVNKIISLAGH